MYRLHKIFLRFTENYQPDARALSLMRIGIALVIIADLFTRGADLTAHYTDDGVWPSHLIYNFGWNRGYWSLHALSGNFYWIILLFSLHFIFALSLLLGYKTILSTFLTWVFTISLHNRNIFVLQSGDDLLRLVLFWGLFLPWHRFYSMDASLGKLSAKKNILAGPGYLMLIASVYLFSVLLKTSSEWHQEGSAIYYALSLEQLRLPLGDWLYNYPNLMQSLTHVVYYLELFIPAFILLPSKTGRLRLLAFLLIVILHVGIGLTLYVGLFYMIGMVTAIGLLPDVFFQKLGLKLKPKLVFSKTSIRWKKIVHYTSLSITAIALCICLIVNLSSIGWFPYQLRGEMTCAVNILRLNQYWGMFSPSVLKEDGWFVYHGMDSIGRQWDLRRNEDYVDYSKPKHIVSMYSSDRWRKLAENMQNDTYTFLRPLYCKYILKTWNKHHPEKKIKTLNVYYMQKTNLEAYKTEPAIKKLHCLCDEH